MNKVEYEMPEVENIKKLCDDFFEDAQIIIDRMKKREENRKKGV